MTTRFRTAVGLAAALALVAGGCGGGTADVSGRVTYQGKPVVYGTVVVIGPDGVPKSGPIRPDGTYTVSGVKAGTARVAVSSPPPPGAEPGRGAKGKGDEADPDKVPLTPPPPGDPAVVKGWFPLPEKFADPAKSGLTTEAGAGRPFDIDLK